MFVTQNNSATEQFNIQLPLTRAALVRQTKIDRTRATNIFPFSLSFGFFLLVRMTPKITVRYATNNHILCFIFRVWSRSGASATAFGSA
jgi:hypothetical protein